MRSSRIHILDTKPNPREPRVVKVIEGDELAQRTGYSCPHTAHCEPDGIYLNGLGRVDGGGPGGIFVLDAETFDLRGPMPTLRDRATLAQVLPAFGIQLVREVSDPDVVAVFRLAIAEAVQAPEVARTLDSLGARRAGLRCDAS